MFDVFYMPDAEGTKLQDKTAKQVPRMGSMLVSQELGRRILALRLARDLIPIRSTDPPYLLALFPHYFSDEVVP